MLKSAKIIPHMASFGQKKRITEYLYSRPIIAVLLVVVFFLGTAVYERYTIEREMHMRRVETQEQKQELIQRKADLEEKVEYLSGDRGIEEEIRTHFDVAKEGETVVILVGEEDEDKNDGVTPVPSEKPWYMFWQ